MRVLRPYQEEGVASALRELETHRSSLVVWPTGGGKTVLFAKVAEAFAAHGKRTLVLAHREELIRQAVEKISAWTSLECDVEMADERAIVSGLYGYPVIVASVQSISRDKRLARFPRDWFGLVVVDEAHHATANSYRAILDHFGPAKVLGVTATPDRSDETAMGIMFESVAHVVEIRDAIEGGYLVPVRQKAVFVDGLDLSRVRTTAGDLNEGDLERLMLEEGHLHRIAQPIVELAGNRKTLVFATTVEHAKQLSEVMGNYARDGRRGAAAYLHGGSDDRTRSETLQAFAAGDIQYLANCALFTEGFDLPAISCVAVARPTKSRAFYSQMVGRGTRLFPGKESLLILDFEGNAGRHSLVNALDILDGNTDPEVKARAQRLLDGRDDLSVIDALDQAASILADEARNRARVLALARKRVVDVDPFTTLGIRPRPGRWGGAAATEKQLALLARFGFPAKGLDKGQASTVIDELIGRRTLGLCSYKQAKLLARYGLNADVSFKQAGETIDSIAQSGWRVTEETMVRHEAYAIEKPIVRPLAATGTADAPF